jgi:hypothetical protein
MMGVRLAVILSVSVLIAEAIGIVRFAIGPAQIALLPLIFAFLVALLFNPNVVAGAERFLRLEAVRRSAAAVGVSVMPLIALLSISVGSELETLRTAGMALIAQELGNLGTMVLAMPVAVLAFRMGREAIGATFSIGREGALAFIFSRYGAAGPEASGVMAMYVCGTFLGAAFFSIVPPLIAQLGLFDLRALAMACGTGSASMTAACATSLGANHPVDSTRIAALATASNLASGLTGLVLTVFLTMPLIERYFALLTRLRRPA